MNRKEYRTYLNSPYWKELRQRILANRNRCQICGQKHSLNLHHKTYENLGKEADSDFIVLCQDCHLRKHKMPKWKKAMKKGEALNFTASKPHTHSKITSNILRRCSRCNEEHPIFYIQYSFGLRLCMHCPNSKPRIQNLKFEADLDIPKRYRSPKKGEKSDTGSY